MSESPSIPKEPDYSEWSPLAKCSDVTFLRTEVERLWDILDSIDTLPDMIHPETLEGYKNYYKGFEHRHKKRHENTTSLDGYVLSVKVGEKGLPEPV